MAGAPVLVVRDNGVFEDMISSSNVDAARVEMHEGILTPGFVNAHCHLELSHLKGQILKHTGLPAFAREIIIKRNSAGEAEQLERMIDADRYMYENGMVAVGDICNTALSAQIKNRSKVFYHSFVELIGLNPARKEIVMSEGAQLLKHFRDQGLRASLAPHAPYSTSRELIGAIATADAREQMPFSIHNQESPEEKAFFESASGGFKDLYDFLKLDLWWFVPPKTSSLAWYAPNMAHSRSVLVHNTCTEAADVALLKQYDAYWCFCPRANLYIESRLPDFALFSEEKERLCLGTDSLASNDDLDLCSEANVIFKNAPTLNMTNVLRMMTGNGAKALGLEEEFGGFIKGKNAGLNLVEFKSGQMRLTKKLC